MCTHDNKSKSPNTKTDRLTIVFSHYKDCARIERLTKQYREEFGGAGTPATRPENKKHEKGHFARYNSFSAEEMKWQIGKAV